MFALHSSTNHDSVLIDTACDEWNTCEGGAGDQHC